MSLDYTQLTTGLVWVRGRDRRSAHRAASLKRTLSALETSAAAAFQGSLNAFTDTSVTNTTVTTVVANTKAVAGDAEVCPTFAAVAEQVNRDDITVYAF